MRSRPRLDVRVNCASSSCKIILSTACDITLLPQFGVSRNHSNTELYPL